MGISCGGGEKPSPIYVSPPRPSIEHTTAGRTPGLLEGGVLDPVAEPTPPLFASSDGARRKLRGCEDSKEC